MKKGYIIIIFCFMIACGIIASRMAGGTASGNAGQNSNSASEAATEKKVSKMTTAELFDAIMSSPQYSSNTRDYLDAHEAEHKQLLKNKETTLKYIFKQFLNGQKGEGENGLKGALMVVLLNELAPESVIDLAAPPQEYFDAWMDMAKQETEGHDDAWIKSNYPAAHILFQMLAEQ